GHLDRAIKLEPGNATHLARKAGVYYNMGANYKEANTDLPLVTNGLRECLDQSEKAIRLDDKCALAYAYRAAVWYHQPDFVPLRVRGGTADPAVLRRDAAREDCELALQLDPNLALAHWVRGLCYQTLDKRVEAQSFEKAFELDPSLRDWKKPRR